MRGLLGKVEKMVEEIKCTHDFALYWNGKKFVEKCYYCGKERGLGEVDED